MFEKFKLEYPRREGSNHWKVAEAIFNKMLLGFDADIIISGAGNYRVQCEKLKIVRTPFVMQAQRFLRNEIFMEYQPAKPLNAPKTIFVLEENPLWPKLVARLGKRPPMKDFGWWFPDEWVRQFTLDANGENSCGN